MILMCEIINDPVYTCIIIIINFVVYNMLNLYA